MIKFTAKQWLIEHREEYPSRVEAIKQCSQILNISKRAARKAMQKIEEKNSTSLEELSDKPSINVDTVKGLASMSLISEVPKTPEELVKEIGLDEQFWEVYKGICNFWGNAENPHYQSKVWFKRIVSVLEEDFLCKMLDLMKEFTPKYPKLKYPKLPENNMLEIGLNDMHFGQQAWGKETGDDYNLEIGLERFENAADRILAAASTFSISEILWPLGHDFFNVNNSLGTTAFGTPQDEDSRWFKVYIDAFKTTIRIIDKCRTLAPVNIEIIPGNHDAERIMYFGHALWAWYRDCEEVNVNISPEPYKFYLFGKNLIGMTHGKNIKGDKLPLLMATEVPELWAKATYWEWHTGHYHHKNKTVFLPLQEFNGVRVRTLPSLCARDSWHKLKGYGGLKEAVGLIWSKTEGNIAEFSFHVNN